MNGMGLVERAEAVGRRLELLSGFQDVQHQAAALRTRREQLGQRAAPLALLAEVQHQFRVADIDVEAAPSNVASMRVQTQERRAAFAADPVTAADPDDSTFKYTYLQGLDSIATYTRERLLHSWQRHLDGLAPSLQDELLGVLGMIDELRQPVLEIRRLQQDLASHHSTLPQYTATIASARETALALADRWAALPTEGINDEVMAFLRSAVEPRGASFVGLSEGVAQWLEGHGLLHALRVVFR